MDRNKSIITQAKRLGLVGKHAGSKPINRMLRSIGQNASMWYWHFKAMKARNNK